jgi:predicted ArsR family transcriptional regulator
MTLCFGTKEIAMARTEPLARNTDPSTSHEAAQLALNFQAQHHRNILDALRVHGPMGKDTIGARAGLTGVQVSRRLAELEKLKKVRATGTLVRSNSGRAEREWALA